MSHRLAEVVEEGAPLRRLHPRAELGGHDPDEVDDLERVLQDVLPIARAEPQPSEHLDELLAELAAVRLEDGLRARLVDLLPELGLGLDHISSIRAGWIRPSSISFSSVIFAIPRRIPSKDERTTA